MLAGADASITSMASSEIYNAMQTGILNAANTSSSSFVSYRIYEQVSCYTPAGDVALWFMYQPLLMNKSTFEGLNEEQQAALLAASEKAEAFYLEEAKKQDAASVEVFQKANVEIAEMSPEDFDAWRFETLSNYIQGKTVWRVKAQPLSRVQGTICSCVALQLYRLWPVGALLG